MPRKWKHHEPLDIASLSLNPDAAREVVARRLPVPQSSRVAHTQASPSSASPGQLSQQPQQTFILPTRPALPSENRKQQRLLEIIAAAPGWDRGVVACLDIKFQPRYRATGGRWVTENPSTWDRRYLQALSKAVYFSKPAELNERQRRQLNTRPKYTWLGLTTRDILKVVGEMRAEKEADGQARAVEAADQPGWTASLAFR